MKAAIVIHGYHSQAEQWEDIMWGAPISGKYGSIPTGLREALRFDAEIVIFPTGGSEKDELLEGEQSLKMARERIGTLPEFAAMGAEGARVWLDARAVTELTSRDTREEVLACGRIAREQRIERLVLVSRPTHILRAYHVALELFSEDPDLRPLLHGLCAIAADVSYAGTHPSDVLVIEPPHRPDRSHAPFHATLAPVTKFMKHDELAKQLNEELRQVIAKYETKLLP